MLVRIENGEEAVLSVCLDLFGRQLVFTVGKLCTYFH